MAMRTAGRSVRRSFWRIAGGISAAAIVLLGLPACPAPDSAPEVAPDAENVAPPPVFPNEGSVVGTNLSPISDWSPEWAFLDCFKTSRPWISGTADVFDDSRTLALDANGWVMSLEPGQFAKTLLFWGQSGTYPGGEYSVLYDGSGTMSYAGAEKVAGTAGRDRVRVDPSSGGWQLWITGTDPADPIRNIRVIMPGGGSSKDPYSWWTDGAECPHADFEPFERTYQACVFHPAFIRTIRNYKVLRFMDWMGTNNSAQREWTDRPTTCAARWTARGVPAEVMCRLANTLHADPWFCMPHMATDDYMRQFAAVVRDNLAPDLHAYVEYSNELWNGGFGQSLYARQEGLSRNLSTDPAAAGAFYAAERSMRMFDIFSEVMGGTQRLRRVLATQAAGWYLGEMELVHGNAFQNANVLAIAPYFGLDFGSPENERSTQSMTLNKLFAEIQDTALPQTFEWMDANAALARKYGLELVAYEGGQSLQGYLGVENNATINALFDAANRDARMGQAYTDYLKAWKLRGGGMFVHYLNCMNYTKWGRWGALEHLGQDPSSAPKHAALQQYIEDNR